MEEVVHGDDRVRGYLGYSTVWRNRIGGEIGYGADYFTSVKVNNRGIEIL